MLSIKDTDLLSGSAGTFKRSSTSIDVGELISVELGCLIFCCDGHVYCDTKMARR